MLLVDEFACGMRAFPSPRCGGAVCDFPDSFFPWFLSFPHSVLLSIRLPVVRAAVLAGRPAEAADPTVEVRQADPVLRPLTVLAAAVEMGDTAPVRIFPAEAQPVDIPRAAGIPPVVRLQTIRIR